ncbi:hypothetical protein QBC44DRAFT_302901 [Cladorrhinum sp. PSN332]|nr:hypothetical protein QBC44DRAFT_302901 [Cladorrhinum sp. PSN332]
MDHQLYTSFIVQDLSSLPAPQLFPHPFDGAAEQLQDGGFYSTTHPEYFDPSCFGLPVNSFNFNPIENAEAQPDLGVDFDLSEQSLPSPFQNTQPLCTYQTAESPPLPTENETQPAKSFKTSYSEIYSRVTLPSSFPRRTRSNVPPHLRNRIAAAKARRKRRTAEEKLNEADRSMMDKRDEMLEEEQELRKQMHALRDQMRMHLNCGPRCSRLHEYLKKTEHWDKDEERKILYGVIVSPSSQGKNFHQGHKPVRG